MNIKQLRYVFEIANNGFNISLAAESLFTTQPGVSTQLKLLEDELGTSIFIRHGKRVTGLTEAGERVLAYAGEVLLNVSSIRNIGLEYSKEDRGTLSIATTHTQARYALPKTVSEFAKRFPRVRLRIHQGNPSQICEMVVRGEADFVIATESIADYEQLLMLPVYRWNRCVVAPPDHPILAEQPLTLETIADYPIITYDFAFAGRSVINKAFNLAGIKPNIVLTAIDSDVIKHYVELGMGVGLLAHMAFDEHKDQNLRAADVSHLFDYSTTSIGVRRGRYLRRYMYDFIEMFAPNYKREAIAGKLRPGSSIPVFEEENLPLR
ncbi:MAG: CysB family HTH-type transcriptional regulator [Gammaproteobacteria bacterium]|nr:CysB family HTH-type transcriptional regulator [Gammaproteobacteria bacterium]MDH5693108.1 CysB family HTH-type transcriptional regulator [Gammaproteobacteria bacterium]